MCFNYKASFLTFIIGIISSISLIKFGNNKYKIDNLIFGIFFIFISAIQLMDFLFWIDISNKIGINHITTLLGPILNVGQPIILYLIKLIILKPTINNFNYSDITVGILNILYMIYLINMYINFIFHGKLTTGVKHGHLSWPWIEFANSIFYLFLISVNIFYLTDFYYSLYIFLIINLFFWISYKYFYYSLGELWCFFGAFLPILFILMSYLLNIK
jgi:hypothetical protein